MIVWLASYPRSGNTFLRVILNSIFDRKTYSTHGDLLDISADKGTSDIVGHASLPEDFDIDRARDSDELYLIKTHEPPPNDNDKAIYLIRDGRECCLSYQRYQNRFAERPVNLTDVIYGNTPFGNWGQHLEAWRPATRHNTLLIKFEDLTDKPQDYIEQLAEFIGIAPAGGEIPSFAKLREINPDFFRSGKKSSWKKVFSTDEHLAFWLKNYSQMSAYGYVDDMPAAFSSDEHASLLSLISRENAYFQDRLQRTIAEKDALIARRDDLLQQVWATNSNLQQQLQEKNRKIQSDQQAHINRDEQMQQVWAKNAKLRQQLQEKDHKIQSAQQTLIDRDEKLHSLWGRNAGLNQRVEAGIRKIAAGDAALKEARVEKDAALHELRAEKDRELRSERARSQELDKLGEAIRGLCRHSVVRSPRKKLQAYKKMVSIYNELRPKLKPPG